MVAELFYLSINHIAGWSGRAYNTIISPGPILLGWSYLGFAAIRGS